MAFVPKDIVTKRLSSARTSCCYAPTISVNYVRSTKETVSSDSCCSSVSACEMKWLCLYIPFLMHMFDTSWALARVEKRMLGRAFRSAHTTYFYKKWGQFMLEYAILGLKFHWHHKKQVLAFFLLHICPRWVMSVAGSTLSRVASAMRRSSSGRETSAVEQSA